MSCLYITLFFNIVAGIVQTFIKFWNQLLYPRVIEVCRLRFEPRHDFFLQFVVNISPSFGEFTTPLCHILSIHNVTINSNDFFVPWNNGTICLWISAGRSFLCWEIIWRNVPGIWRDFGSVLSFQKHVSSNKAGSTIVKRARLTGKESRSTAMLS